MNMTYDKTLLKACRVKDCVKAPKARKGEKLLVVYGPENTWVEYHSFKGDPCNIYKELSEYNQGPDYRYFKVDWVKNSKGRNTEVAKFYR